MQMLAHVQKQGSFVGDNDGKGDLQAFLKRKEQIQKLKAKLSRSSFNGEVPPIQNEIDQRARDGTGSANSGLTPVSSQDEDDRGYGDEGSKEDADNNFMSEDYKNEAYWSLPENVRNAIDFARTKSKHSDFYGKLKGLTDKLGVYTQVFYTKAPKFERVFLERKRKKLEQMMLKE